MPQIFSPGSNTVFRTALVLSPFLLVGSLFAIYRLNYSSWATQVGVPIDQPVPFSHEHHVAGLGIDCRYCHTSVEQSAFAGMPSTRTCSDSPFPDLGPGSDPGPGSGELSRESADSLDPGASAGGLRVL